MEQQVLDILRHSLPYIQDRIGSKDLQIYYSGPQVFGYPSEQSAHQLHVVHRSTLVQQWEVSYPGQTEVTLRVTAVPLRKAIGTFTGLKKLALLGEMVYSTDGKCAKLMNDYTSSAEFLDVLARTENFNSTMFYRTEARDYFYNHLYAYHVALRTKMTNRVDLVERPTLFDLLREWSSATHDSVSELIAQEKSLQFDEFAVKAINILKLAGVKVLDRYDGQ